MFGELPSPNLHVQTASGLQGLSKDELGRVTSECEALLGKLSVEGSGGRGTGSEEKVDRADDTQATVVDGVHLVNVSRRKVEGKASFCKPC